MTNPERGIPLFMHRVPTLPGGSYSQVPVVGPEKVPSSKNGISPEGTEGHHSTSPQLIGDPPILNTVCLNPEK